MLVVETIARIRREHFVKGKTIKEIARYRKVSRNTVRKVLRSGETLFEYGPLAQPRPKLGRWASELEEVLVVSIRFIARRACANVLLRLVCQREVWIRAV
ncbi:transposase [Bradyrhizobium sp. AZCC 1588]